MTHNHYYYLNFFRLFAAFVVLISHARCELFATYLSLNPESQNMFTQLFFVGVGWTPEALAIFFVLSGFLVGGIQMKRLSLVRNEHDPEAACRSLFDAFVIGRMTKIILPLAFAILFAALVKMMGNIDFSWWDALLNLFGLQLVLASDFGGVYWTIAYEIWFYVLIAGIIGLFCGKRRLLFGLVLILISSFVFIKLYSYWFFVFLLGSVLYYVKDQKFPKYLLLFAIAGIVVAKMLSLLSIESHVYRFALYGKTNGDMLQFTTSMCIGVVMTMLVNRIPQKPFAQWIERFGNRWSSFTYSLYITHFSVLELFRHFFGQMVDVNVWTMLVYVGMIILCLCVGYVFYFLIEHKLGGYVKKVLLP